MVVPLESWIVAFEGSLEARALLLGSRVPLAAESASQVVCCCEVVACGVALVVMQFCSGGVMFALVDVVAVSGCCVLLLIKISGVRVEKALLKFTLVALRQLLLLLLLLLLQLSLRRDSGRVPYGSE
jgi:hypothetical protein